MIGANVGSTQSVLESRPWKAYLNAMHAFRENNALSVNAILIFFYTNSEYTRLLIIIIIFFSQFNLYSLLSPLQSQSA